MTAKIQIFESNSQQKIWLVGFNEVVYDRKDTNFWKQFTTLHYNYFARYCCLWPQRYKFLKAIHNTPRVDYSQGNVVYDRKDTNFWKQFTTTTGSIPVVLPLFMTAKIQIFESNSQHLLTLLASSLSCLWPQRYKFLKAIHNLVTPSLVSVAVVYDRKDTNFWKQFTTWWAGISMPRQLFMTAKIQIFESNSQLGDCSESAQLVVYDRKDTNFWKQFTTRDLIDKS